MTDPTFTTRDELSAWARQRMRFPDPRPDARLRAVADVRRVTAANGYFLNGETR